jgi:hypothetical protein
VTALYLDESIFRAVLANVLLTLGALWIAWLAGWLRRVELRNTAQPAVSDLGLTFAWEGFRGRVRARGVVGGQPVVVTWSGSPPRARVRVGSGPSRWVEVEEVVALVRGVNGAAATVPVQTAPVPGARSPEPGA